MRCTPTSQHPFPSGFLVPYFSWLGLLHSCCPTNRKARHRCRTLYAQVLSTSWELCAQSRRYKKRLYALRHVLYMDDLFVIHSSLIIALVFSSCSVYGNNSRILMIMVSSSYEPTNFVAQLFLHPCVLMQSVLNNHQFRIKIIRDALPLLVPRRRHGNSSASPVSRGTISPSSIQNRRWQCYAS